jgi:beta-N-acetylhexosaminidase
MFISGFEGTVMDGSNVRIRELLQEGLGGVIFFGKNISSYEQTRALVAELKALSPIPAYMSIDQEGERVCRTKHLPQFIKYRDAAKLGATGKTETARAQTEVMSRELKYLGFNMDNAPVLDVNSNPANPIIGTRSFGATPEKVFKFAREVYKTFQKNGIAPVGKHFPGHGDTNKDSHLELPFVAMPLGELERTHIKPFADAFRDGLDAVMVAHVHYRAFNPDTVTPSSLSKEVITDYLKDRLGFKGLAISDDMVMQGAAAGRTPAEMFIQAINAGIDVIVYKDSHVLTPELFEQLARAVRDGKISGERVDASARNILEHKERHGILNLSSAAPIATLDLAGCQREIDRSSL